MTATIRFFANEANKTQGLLGSNVEQFRDNPFRSCARETGQNSNDARLKAAQSAPVRIEYNLLEVSADYVPFRTQLKEIVGACLEKAEERCERRKKSPGKDPEVRFFKRAESILNRDQFKVLEIADYNTTGLTGPFDDEYSVFSSLVKSDGDNNKDQKDSGGSYGLGKNAAFAVSDLQTVVYSTLTLDDQGAEIHGCQGRLQLISHERKGQKFAAEGYWGEEGFSAITGTSSLPTWMRRKERGTSIFAIGFRFHDDWANRILLSILTNFLFAIMRGQMEVSIDSGRLVVNSSTLQAHLFGGSVKRVAEQTGELESLYRTIDLHQCLTSGATVEQKFSIRNENDVSVRILVSEDLERPRSVLFVRNGMFITDNLKEFGFPLRAFRGTQPYIAVVEPSETDTGRTFSEFLKRMENPTHDTFSPERIRDEKDVDAARASIKLLYTKLREAIKSVASVAQTDATSLDELARLFNGDPDPENNANAEERDPERYIVGKAKPSQRKKNSVSATEGDGTAGGAGGKLHNDTDRGKTSGAGDGEGSGGTGSKKQAPLIPLYNKRCPREGSGSGYSHRLYLTPGSSGKALIRMQASGLTSATPLAVLKSERGDLSGGGLTIDLKEGERLSIGVSFQDGYDGPVEFSSHALMDGDVK